MVNPNDLRELDNINTEICEQRFVHVNKYAGMLRFMNEQRFQWTISTVVEMDHVFRRQGLLGSETRKRSLAGATPVGLQQLLQL